MTAFPVVIRDDLPQVAEALGGRMRRLSGKHVLITGASGMLPAYLADVLVYLNTSGRLDSPCRVTLVSRSADRVRKRLGHLLSRPDVDLVVCDLRSGPPPGVEPDFLVHAGAPASPQDYLADPVGSLDAATLCLRGLLELARQLESQSFLYVSTSEIYGTPDPDAIPTKESYVGRIDPLSRRAYYAEAKRAGETYCRAYYEQHAVRVKIARPFHVHGPGLRIDDGRVVAALIAMGLRGERLALRSDGSATRTYGYISDASVALLSILLSERDGEAFNVGAETPETSVLELASQIAQLLGQTEPVLTQDQRADPQAAGSPSRACPDLGKIREILGFVPRVSLVDGLSRTISWFRASGE